LAWRCAHWLGTAFALSAATACSASNREAGSDSTAQSARGGQPPDFELDSLDGKSVRLSDHLGKEVVLIDFWATFCDPCLAAMPHLDELYKKYKGRGFVVLGISIDGPDSVAQVKAEVAKLGVSFPILLDQESRVVSLYNPKTSAPYSVLIGRDGRVIKKQEGYSTGNAGNLEADLKAALGVVARALPRSSWKRRCRTPEAATALSSEFRCH
jgi:peroxiredoxin